MKEKPKRFSKYIKGEGLSRERLGPLRNQKGHLVEPQEMGQILNKYFSSVFIHKDWGTWDC